MVGGWGCGSGQGDSHEIPRTPEGAHSVSYFHGKQVIVTVALGQGTRRQGPRFCGAQTTKFVAEWSSFKGRVS